MAPPSTLSFQDNCRVNNSSLSSTSTILLSPFPSSCLPSSVCFDHDYVIRNHVEMKSPPDLTPDSCNSPVKSDQFEVMTPADERTPQRSLCDEVKEELFGENRLVGLKETPLSKDLDFLQALDELDFDLDDTTTPCNTKGTDDNNNYINSSSSSNNNDTHNLFLRCMEGPMFGDFLIGDYDSAIIDKSTSSPNRAEGEDVYKKEFFLKHLGLHRATPEISKRRNRKRKLEEVPEQTSRPLTLTSLHTSQTSLSTSPLSMHTFQRPLFSSDGQLGLTSPNTSLNELRLTHSIPNLPLSPPLTPTHTVPYKLGSCCACSRPRNPLYSTAMTSQASSVQTSPSTLCTSKHNKNNINSNNHSFPALSSTQEQQTFSPSTILSDALRKDFEFEFLDRGEVDEDTEDLLEWLDSQDLQAAVIDTPADSLAEYSPSSSPCSSDVDSQFDDDLEACLSPSGHQSLAPIQMDTFTDLEAFAAEEPEQIPNISCQDVTKLKSDSKMYHSKSHLPLTILTDFSSEFVNSDMGVESYDVTKSCHTHHTLKRNNEIAENQNFCHQRSSSLLASPSFTTPTSSPSSSPVSDKFDRVKNSRGLHLLDLFSDDNSSMLLSGCDAALINTVRFM